MYLQVVSWLEILSALIGNNYYNYILFFNAYLKRITADNRALNYAENHIFKNYSSFCGTSGTDRLTRMVS